MKRQNIKNYITRGILSLLLLGGLPNLTSCSSDDDMPQPHGAAVQGQTVGFTIAVPRVNGGTRAADKWGDDYTPDDEGTDFENQIKTLMPSLYMVNGDNISPVGSIVVNTDPLLTKVDENSEYYYIQGELRTNLSADDLNNGTFRLMVEANTEANHTWMPNRKYFMLGTQQDLEAKSLAIPMWGVAEANFSGVGEVNENGESQAVINIHPSASATDKTATVSLLRAAAKVTVKVSSEIADRHVVLNKLTLNTAAKEGYIYPGDWNSISDTENLLFSKTFNAFEDTSNFASSYPVANPDNVDTEISFYLAETPNPDKVYANHGANPEHECTELCLEVEYTRDNITTETKKGNLYFTDNSDATKPAHTTTGVTQENIIRNHIYEFTITGVADSYKPEVKLCIKKWSHEQISIDL